MKKIIITEQQYRSILAENRLDVLRQQYVNKRVKNDNQQEISNEDFDKISSADPSSNNQYTSWLLNLYFWKQLKLEDLYKATQYLQVFDKNKSKLTEKDINKKINGKYYYDSLSKLYNTISDYIDNSEGGDESKMGSNELLRKIKNEEVEKYYEDDTWLIVIPKTERASCLYGKGTQWCTAADKGKNMFDKYNQEGNLYININKKTNKKYQFHFENNQFMDENDRPTAILFIDEVLFNIYFDKVKDVERLELDDIDIGSFPKHLINLKNLKSLYLQSNGLSELPDSIGNINNLKVVNLSNNFLKKLPETIGNLINLEELYLHNNNLEELPKSIGKLTKLKILNLDENELKELPNSIENLKNLIKLNISDNQLLYDEQVKIKKLLPNTLTSFHFYLN